MREAVSVLDLDVDVFPCWWTPIQVGVQLFSRSLSLRGVELQGKRMSGEYDTANDKCVTPPSSVACLHATLSVSFLSAEHDAPYPSTHLSRSYPPCLRNMNATGRQMYESDDIINCACGRPFAGLQSCQIMHA